MKIWDFIKGGLKMVKDKTVNTIANIGKILKDRENRLITGIIILGMGVGIGGSLIISAYVKAPQ